MAFCGPAVTDARHRDSFRLSQVSFPESGHPADESVSHAERPTGIPGATNAQPPTIRMVPVRRNRSGRKSKAPARLAERAAFFKPKASFGSDAKDQNLCSPNGVAQVGPRSIRCDEMRSVLRLVGVSDTSELAMVAHAFRGSFNHEIETVEGALSRREDATTIG
jgi:hypothetical protein